ncbi:oxidoreductase [Altererythrobacter sp. B11]|uniref:SDR family NAD(P)-dependent oxidoreductase n=1 Tax=Altererythrobacter sp. B11 TaxID=2060312 RepID=UPI000DC6EC8F|nr:SDR family NAD(P)-dependent oxidoreductase [Altererythrobacter sp. B11]BBC71543.1 oxidoreductase [Altererythrobacter sp. B11]
MTESFTHNRILVTGASGGLGGALAQHYARKNVTLSLWGRDRARLEAVAERCRSVGAQVDIRMLDLTDLPAALAALEDEDAKQPFDLALLVAGRGDVKRADEQVEDAEIVARLAAINFAAPAAMAALLGRRMAARRHGRIVLIGSAAAFHSLPFAAAYSGSKAGLARFADALRLGLREHGVQVTLVSPGFIDTATGRKVPGPKPMLMAPDAVAARIARAVAAGTAHIVLPWPFVALRWLDRLLPALLRDRLLLALSPP